MSAPVTGVAAPSAKPASPPPGSTPEPRSRSMAESKPAPGGVGHGRLFVAAFAGPGAWALDLVARYFLVESGVAGPHELGVMSIGFIALLVAAAASIWCLGIHRRVRGKSNGAEFISLLGVALGAFTSLAIGAELIPHYFFDGLSPP
jgi:hypothetical protein